MKKFVFAALVALAAVGFLPTGYASAEPETDQEVIGASITDGTTLICPFFDTQGANGNTLNQIGQHYIDKGYTPAQSAKIVSMSVKTWCSQYLPALNVASSNNSGSTMSSGPVQRYIRESAQNDCTILRPDPLGDLLATVIKSNSLIYQLSGREMMSAMVEGARIYCPDVLDVWENGPLPSA